MMKGLDMSWVAAFTQILPVSCAYVLLVLLVESAYTCEFCVRVSVNTRIDTRICEYVICVVYTTQYRREASH